MDTDATLQPDPALLPDDPALLKALVMQLLEELQKANARLARQEHHMHLLLKWLYGSTSEKRDPRQGELFDSQSSVEDKVEEAASVASAAAPPASSPAAKKRHKHGRGRIPERIQREEMVHDFSEAEMEAMGGAENLVELPAERSEQLDWRPSTLFVVIYVRKKYARRTPLPESGLTLVEQNVAVARKPAEAIPGALAAPGLMSQVIVCKGTDHLPLYRQEGIFKRQGVRLSRQTMDGWLDIDNNEGENSLRGLCLGRKNWLFLGSDRGGRAAAVHFSLLASCKRHGHDPWAYYRDILIRLIRLPAMLPTASEEELLALRPHRWHPA
jgi:transposase